MQLQVKYWPDCLDMGAEWRTHVHIHWYLGSWNSDDGYSSGEVRAPKRAEILYFPDFPDTSPLRRSTHANIMISFLYTPPANSSNNNNNHGDDDALPTLLPV